MLQIPEFYMGNFKVRMGMQTLKKKGTAQSRVMQKKEKVISKVTRSVFKRKCSFNNKVTFQILLSNVYIFS